jgi:hypothetical protein
MDEDEDNDIGPSDFLLKKKHTVHYHFSLKCSHFSLKCSHFFLKCSHFFGNGVTGPGPKMQESNALRAKVRTKP